MFFLKNCLYKAFRRKTVNYAKKSSRKEIYYQCIKEQLFKTVKLRQKNPRGKCNSATITSKTRTKKKLYKSHPSHS